MEHELADRLARIAQRCSAFFALAGCSFAGAQPLVREDLSTWVVGCALAAAWTLARSVTRR